MPGALVVFREISKHMMSDAVLRRRAFPTAFRHVGDGDALMIWLPDMLKPSHIHHRSHDPVYVASIFRTSPFSIRDDMQPYELMPYDEGPPGLIIRVKDIRYVFLLHAWITQRMQHLQLVNNRIHLPLSGSLIRNIVSFVPTQRDHITHGNDT